MANGSQQRPGPDFKGMTDLSGTVDVVFVLVNIHLACFTQVLRVKQGVRSTQWYGPLALIWMIGYAQSTHCAELMLYTMFVWLPACFVQTMFLRDRRQHSRYLGFPILGMWAGEQRGKALEALLLFGVGGYLTTVEPALGAFVMGGGVAAFIKLSFDRSREIAIGVDMRDAQIDAEWQASRNR